MAAMVELQRRRVHKLVRLGTVLDVDGKPLAEARGKNRPRNDRHWRLSRLLWGHGSCCFAFGYLDDAIDTGKGDFLAEAAGPADFELVDPGGRTEAKVDAGVGGGSVTAAAEDVAALAGAASGHEDFRAYGVARGALSEFLGR